MAAASFDFRGSGGNAADVLFRTRVLRPLMYNQGAVVKVFGGQPIEPGGLYKSAPSHNSSTEASEYRQLQFFSDADHSPKAAFTGELLRCGSSLDGGLSRESLDSRGWQDRQRLLEPLQPPCQRLRQQQQQEKMLQQQQLRRSFESQKLRPLSSVSPPRSEVVEETSSASPLATDRVDSELASEELRGQRLGTRGDQQAATASQGFARFAGLGQRRRGSNNPSHDGPPSASGRVAAGSRRRRPVRSNVEVTTTTSVSHSMSSRATLRTPGSDDEDPEQMEFCEEPEDPRVRVPAHRIGDCLPEDDPAPQKPPVAATFAAPLGAPKTAFKKPRMHGSRSEPLLQVQARRMPPPHRGAHAAGVHAAGAASVGMPGMRLRC